MGKRRTWEVVSPNGEHEGIVQASTRIDAQQVMEAAIARGEFPLKCKLVVLSAPAVKEGE